MNILTEREEHKRYCTQPLTYYNRCMAGAGGLHGDVRRCEHGKLMLGYTVPGLVPAMWRTLHPIWTPILFQRARRALQGV